MKWWTGTKNTQATQLDGFSEEGIFTPGDIRNSNYNIKRNWYYNNPLVPSTLGKQCNITDGTWSSGQLFPAVTKFFYGKADNLQLTGSYKDRMKCRLAETYLHLAESYIRKGDAQSAAEAINVVRLRAKAPQVTAADIDMDFLLDERIRELVGEESRRFTLVRTGKYVERVRKYNAAIADKVNENHALWPIPQAILDANREGEFPQNPGYEN